MLSCHHQTPNNHWSVPDFGYEDDHVYKKDWLHRKEFQDLLMAQLPQTRLQCHQVLSCPHPERLQLSLSSLRNLCELSQLLLSLFWILLQGKSGTFHDTHRNVSLLQRYDHTLYTQPFYQNEWHDLKWYRFSGSSWRLRCRNSFFKRQCDFW